MAETKREVFIKLLKYLPVGHEIDWRGDGEEAKDLAGKYLARYDVADKPVIPRAVADWIEQCKQDKQSLAMAMTHWIIQKMVTMNLSWTPC